MHKLLSALFLVGTLTLSGCAAPGRHDESTSARAGYGTVQSVETVDRNSSSVVGTIAGGLVGGLIGHQVGGGRGQTAATIGGAAGGAYLGHEIGQRRASDVYKLAVRMDDGWNQTIALQSDPGLRSGDRVYIDRNGVIRRD